MNPAPACLHRTKSPFFVYSPDWSGLIYLQTVSSGGWKWKIGEGGQGSLLLTLLNGWCWVSSHTTLMGVKDLQRVVLGHSKMGETGPSERFSAKDLIAAAPNHICALSSKQRISTALRQALTLAEWGLLGTGESRPRIWKWTTVRGFIYCFSDEEGEIFFSGRLEFTSGFKCNFGEWQRY